MPEQDAFPPLLLDFPSLPSVARLFIIYFIYLLSQLKWTLGVFSFGCSESRCCEHGWAGISLSLVLSSLGCVHRRGIAGSDGDSMFNF